MWHFEQLPGGGSAEHGFHNHSSRQRFRVRAAPGEEAGAAQSCAEPPQKGTEPKLSQIPPAVWLKPDWEGRGMGKLGDGVEPPRAG